MAHEGRPRAVTRHRGCEMGVDGELGGAVEGREPAAGTCLPVGWGMSPHHPRKGGGHPQPRAWRCFPVTRLPPAHPGSGPASPAQHRPYGAWSRRNPAPSQPGCSRAGGTGRCLPALPARRTHGRPRRVPRLQTPSEDAGPFGFAVVSSATWCPRLWLPALSLWPGRGEQSPGTCPGARGWGEGAGGSFPCASWPSWDQTGSLPQGLCPGVGDETRGPG